MSQGIQRTEAPPASSPIVDLFHAYRLAGCHFGKRYPVRVVTHLYSIVLPFVAILYVALVVCPCVIYLFEHQSTPIALVLGGMLLSIPVITWLMMKKRMWVNDDLTVTGDALHFKLRGRLAFDTISEYKIRQRYNQAGAGTSPSVLYIKCHGKPALMLSLRSHSLSPPWELDFFLFITAAIDRCLDPEAFAAEQALLSKKVQGKRA